MILDGGKLDCATPETSADSAGHDAVGPTDDSAVPHDGSTEPDVTTTIPDVTDPIPDTTTPPPDTGNPCSTCAQSACATEFKSCNADSACVAQISCIQSCTSGDTACENSCVDSNPSTTADNLFNCVGTNCASACGG